VELWKLQSGVEALMAANRIYLLLYVLLCCVVVIIVVVLFFLLLFSMTAPKVFAMRVVFTTPK
jgi:hypothetical protein